jgi:hypothetical protein
MKQMRNAEFEIRNANGEAGAAVDIAIGLPLAAASLAARAAGSDVP